MPLHQPILSTEPDPGHSRDQTLNLEQFLALLREEEDYWAGEQHDTKLIITRLRKIFYDRWGWNKELIRGAANVEGRYIVEIVDDPTEHSKPLRRYHKNEYVPKHRVITYHPDDRVYGDSRVGQTPPIYKNDHEDVRLPSGYHCDVAHILAGLDAFNHPQVVSPLPGFLSFLYFLVPHVDSNMDIVTWLGDIASSSGDFLFDYLNQNKKPLSEEQEQTIINRDAPGSDMLGDIDPYVIAKYYDVGSRNGMRMTEILSDYYYREDSPRSHRIREFCDRIGLKSFNGRVFADEEAWLRQYRRQLRDNVSFQVYSLTEEKLKSIWLPLKVWFNGYRDVLKMELLLQIFLKALKEIIEEEEQVTK